MHDTSFENLELLINNYKNFLSGKDIKVLDIGSRVRTPEKITRWKGIIPDYYEYIGIDIEKGQNVDIVLDSPYKYPFEDNSIDLIIANSIFEHSEFFWELFLELLRILKPSGLLYINAPSNGDFHRGPVDVYRFYPDSGKALEKWGIKNGYENTLLLESYTYKRKTKSWNDFVAIFIKDSDYLNNFKNRVIDNIDNFYNGLSDTQDGFLNFQELTEDHELLLKKQYIKRFMNKFSSPFFIVKKVIKKIIK